MSVYTKKQKNQAFARKQLNESWMFNGAGQPVFMGNAQASQFNSSGTTSPGASYLPDEVAKMLVKESGLRKSDTIPKRVIVGYLESMGLSAGLAVDVAKVLRDVYGITPTFDESTLYARSGALIEELTAASESFPMPFAVNDEPQVLTEVDIIGEFLQKEFMESSDEGDDIVLGQLAMLSPGEFCDVVDFCEWVGPEVFNYIEQIAVDGPSGAAESIVEGLCWPHRIQFMPEDIQAHFDEDAADDVIKNHLAKRMPKIPPLSAKGGARAPAAKSASKPGMKIPSIKKQGSVVPSFRKQMALHGKDQPSDPLASKKPGAALAAHRAKKATAAPAQSPSKMKRAGSTSVSLMKKVGSAAKSASSFAHTPSKLNPDVGPALKKAGSVAGKVGGALGKAGVHAAAGLVGAAGHVGGSAVRGLARGLFGKKEAPADTGAKAKSSKATAAAASDHKPGLIGRIAGAVGKFASHVAHHAKEGFKSATPGIQSQLHKGDDEPKKEKLRVAKSGVGEAVLRSGSLLNEVAHALDGSLPPDDEDEGLVRSPADVIEDFQADTVVDMAALEAISEMDWNTVAGVAGFVMLRPDNFLSLIQSYKESRSAFRTEWFNLEENGGKPEWMSIGSFLTLAKVTLDEGVVPRLVYWAARALQAADEGVASYVAEEYPELGKTVYGPAGDPKEGPQIAKSFMTPQPAGTMTPTDSDACTTRMFSDPAERDKHRKEKLADVMDVINGMRQAAAEAGVPPEGMFLNVYRDMHREKVRYS